MSTATKIVAFLAARPGKTEALKALLETMVAQSRQEPGNLRYDLWRDQADPGRFVLDELYADNAAVAAHRQSPYFKDYLARIGDLAERTAAVLDAVEVA